MTREKITLPSGHEVTLVFFARPPAAKNSAIWWLQLKKMGFKEGMHSEAYTRELPKMAGAFATALLGADDIVPDLVLVPASASKQYQPFLDALVTAKPGLPVAEGVFSKPDEFKAGDKGRTLRTGFRGNQTRCNKAPTCCHNGNATLDHRRHS